MKVRESNYELMRIISMIFIVIYHTIGYGNVIFNTNNIYMRALLYLVRFIVIVHVNSFVLLSGYFQSKSKFKLSKLLSLVLQALFYIVFLNIILFKLGFITDVSKFTLLVGSLPSSIGHYWFISTYILLYIVSDYLNKFIDRMGKEEYKRLLIILFTVVSIIPFVLGYDFFYNNGFSLYNFVFLYFLGGYLRRYPLKESYHFKNFTNMGYFFLMLFVFFLMVFISFSLYIISINYSSVELIDWVITRITTVRLGYATPHVILQSICYFEIFGLLSFRSKIVNYLSSCTFGIYLFHEHKYIRPIIYILLGVNKAEYDFSFGVFKDIFFCVVIIFVIGVIIESLRKLIFNVISKTWIFRKINNGLKIIITSLSYNINW